MSASVRQTILFASVALLFLASIIGLLLFLRPNVAEFENKYTAYFQEQTGCRLEAEAISPDGLLLPKVRMSNIRIFTETGVEALVMRWANLELSVSDLLVGEFGIMGLDMVSPTVDGPALLSCLNKIKIAEDHRPNNQLIQNIPVTIRDLSLYSWARPQDDDPFAEPDINPLPLSENTQQLDYIPKRLQEFYSAEINGFLDGNRSLSLKSTSTTLGPSRLSQFDIKMRFDQAGLERFNLYLRKNLVTPTLNGQLQTTFADLDLVYRPLEKTGRIAGKHLYQLITRDTNISPLPLSIDGHFSYQDKTVLFDKIEGRFGPENFDATAQWVPHDEAASTLYINSQFGIFEQEFFKTLLSDQDQTNLDIDLIRELATLPFELDLGVNATGLSDLNGQISRAPNIHLTAGQGSITLDQFNISLPGGSEFSLLADFVPGDLGQRNWYASGGFSLQSIDFRKSLTWLGFDTSILKVGALHDLRLAGGFDLDGNHLLIKNLTGKTDITDINIQADMQFRADIGQEQGIKQLSAHVKLGKLDLETFLPASDITNDPIAHILSGYKMLYPHQKQRHQEIDNLNLNIAIEELHLNESFNRRPLENIEVSYKREQGDSNLKVAVQDHPTKSQIQFTNLTKNAAHFPAGQTPLHTQIILKDAQGLINELVANQNIPAGLLTTILSDISQTTTDIPSQLNATPLIFTLNGTTSAPRLSFSGALYEHQIETTGVIAFSPARLFTKQNNTPTETATPLLQWTIDQGQFWQSVSNKPQDMHKKSLQYENADIAGKITGYIAYPGDQSVIHAQLSLHDQKNDGKLSFYMPASLATTTDEKTYTNKASIKEQRETNPALVTPSSTKIGLIKLNHWCFPQDIQSILPLFENNICITSDLDLNITTAAGPPTPPFLQITGEIWGQADLHLRPFDTARLPKGLLEKLERNMKTHLLSQNLSYAGYLDITSDSITLKSGRIDGETILGDLTVTRDFKHKNIHTELSVHERQTPNILALHIRLAGPVSRPNLRIKGAWTKN